MHSDRIDVRSDCSLDCEYEEHPSRSGRWVCTVCGEYTPPVVFYPSPPRRNCPKKQETPESRARLEICHTCDNYHLPQKRVTCRRGVGCCYGDVGMEVDRMTRDPFACCPDYLWFPVLIRLGAIRPNGDA